MKSAVIGFVIAIVVGAGLVGAGSAVGRALDDTPPLVRATSFGDSYCDDLAAELDAQTGDQENVSDGPDELVSCALSPSDSAVQLQVTALSSGSTADRTRSDRVTGSLDAACSAADASRAAAQQCTLTLLAPQDDQLGEFSAFATDDGATVVTIVRTGDTATEPIYDLQPLRELLQENGQP